MGRDRTGARDEDIASGKPLRQIVNVLEKGRHEETGPRRRRDSSEYMAAVVMTPVIDEAGRLQR